MIVLLLAGCTSVSSGAAERRARYLMGTVCEIEIPASPAAAMQIASAFGEIERIESFLSTWRTESELSRLNRDAQNAPRSASPELYALLERAASIASGTQGAFNPLVGKLIQAWKTRETGALPDRALLESATASAALDHLVLADGRVALYGGAEIEEGGFGKGYAVDRALAQLRADGTQRAVIDFGGQIGAYGFGDSFESDIAHPEERSTPALRITTRDGAISTSSGSEKTFVVDGRTFSHLIDPRSGVALPPRGSVTVLADDGLTADALSTALYVLGPDGGLAWADSHGVAAIFLAADASPHSYRIHQSRAARERIGAIQILDPRIINEYTKGY